MRSSGAKGNSIFLLVMQSRSMSWLQGGPFLEVSFIMELKTDRQSFAGNLFSELKFDTFHFAIGLLDMKALLPIFSTQTKQGHMRVTTWPISIKPLCK